MSVNVTEETPWKCKTCGEIVRDAGLYDHIRHHHNPEYDEYAESPYPYFVPCGFEQITPGRKALEAIVALVNGVWDDPALVAFGELDINEHNNILRIVKQAIAEAKAGEMRPLPSHDVESLFEEFLKVVDDIMGGGDTVVRFRDRYKDLTGKKIPIMGDPMNEEEPAHRCVL